MRGDREHGFSNLYSSQDLIKAVSDSFCIVCGTSPCYLLATAATVVVQGLLVNEDLVSRTRYVDNLNRLQHCLTRHITEAQEVWQLDKYFQVSKEALSALEELGAEKKNGKSCESNGGP